MSDPFSKSAQSSPRNRFVQRQEPAGTGYQALMILAPSADLLKLAEHIRAIAQQGSGSHAELIAREHEPKSRGAFGFRVVSEDELIALQEPDLGTRTRQAVRTLFWLVILPLAGYGGCTLVGSSL